MEQKLDDEQLRAKVNAETAKISWAELQPHYSRGVVLHVAPGMDLVEVAMMMSRDDRPQFEKWLLEEKVSRVNERQARNWTEDSTVLWAVIVAPWVLVQEVEEVGAVH